MRRVQNVQGLHLVVKENGLFGDHGEVIDGAGLVLVSGNIQRTLGGLHGIVLGFGFVLQHAQRRQIILDLLEGGENGLAIIRRRGVIGGQ